MMTGRVIECVQGDSDWLKAKTGRVTSSRIYDVIQKRHETEKMREKRELRGEKLEELAIRGHLRIDMVGEIISGDIAEHFVSWWMKEGKENEPLARTAYEMACDVELETIGFVVHPMIEMAGTSPDALLGDDGVVEFKCPKLSTHIGYILAGTIPEEYLPQCMWHLACTGRDYCEFVSFHAACPEPHNLFIRRLYRDEKVIGMMEREVEQFLLEVDACIDKIKSSSARTTA